VNSERLAVVRRVAGRFRGGRLFTGYPGRRNSPTIKGYRKHSTVSRGGAPEKHAIPRRRCWIPNHGGQGLDALRRLRAAAGVEVAGFEGSVSSRAGAPECSICSTVSFTASCARSSSACSRFSRVRAFRTAALCPSHGRGTISPRATGLPRYGTLVPMTAQTSERPGRNEPCHCGSGRKYKHCCLEKDEAAAAAARATTAAAQPAEPAREAPRRTPKHQTEQPWKATTARVFVPRPRGPRKVGGS
jgi:hypothetical protein